MWPPPQFFELHSGLPREGPGDDAVTRRAVGLLPELPPDPVVVDAGCGPGGQTLVLAGALGVKVTAIDIHQPFLDALSRRAEGAGLDHLIEPRWGDMSALPFDPATVHLIWCEGAIYQIGFGEGLELWRTLLAEGGIVAASEAVWTVDDPPAEVREWWEREYPAITDGPRTATSPRTPSPTERPPSSTTATSTVSNGRPTLTSARVPAPNAPRTACPSDSRRVPSTCSRCGGRPSSEKLTASVFSARP